MDQPSHHRIGGAFLPAREVFDSDLGRALAGVRRLSWLGHNAKDVGEVERLLAEELLTGLTIDQVHIQRPAGDGHPGTGIAYLQRGIAREPYDIPADAADAAPQLVASMGHAVRIADTATSHWLSSSFVNRWQIRCALVLSFGGSTDGDSVVILARRTTREFAAVEVELASTLVDQASTALSLVHARQEARIDPLTGALNRRAMSDRLHEEIERARRVGTPLSCLLLDLDDFKQINDLHGHRMGDAVLAGVARVLDRVSRSVDRVARYGGDEYVVILPGTASSGAELLGRRVLSGITELRAELRVPTVVSASIGIAQWSEPDSAIDLIHHADEAMLRGKRSGKSHVTY